MVAAKPRRTKKKRLQGAARSARDKAQAEEGDRVAAWKMRLAGKKYREIGEALGISITTAHKWVARCIRDAQQEGVELRAEVRATAMAQLEPCAALAAEMYLETGDPKHMAALATAQKRMADLVGADAPKAVEVSGPKGGPLRFTSMTDAELAEIAGES